MGPRRKGAKKIKMENVPETKEQEHSDSEPSDGSIREENPLKKKMKGAKKYIGAHVSISGEQMCRFLNDVFEFA